MPSRVVVARGAVVELVVLADRFAREMELHGPVHVRERRVDHAVAELAEGEVGRHDAVRDVSGAPVAGLVAGLGPAHRDDLDADLGDLAGNRTSRRLLDAPRGRATRSSGSGAAFVPARQATATVDTLTWES